ncbi:MAG: hypothetical protein LBS62_07085 [Clostridiales bacterium]|jgi:hypothetical protein|nr:hypothetical protein [Clostridiales bacterium]
MDSEKMKVLKMLEEHKITAEEAARLMQSLGTEPSGGVSSSVTGPSGGAADTVPVSNSRPSDVAGPSGGSPAPRIDFENFGAEMGRKFDSLARDWEPKLRKITEKVVEKTVAAADKISRTIAEESAAYAARTSASPTGGSVTSSAFSADGGGNFDASVLPGDELSLEGFNGDVTIRGYNGDKMTIKAVSKSARPGVSMRLVKRGKKYMIDYDPGDFEKMAFDALIPERMFSAVNISTSNGLISVTSLKSANARITNFNGPIHAERVDFAYMEMSSVNGAVTARDTEFDAYSDYVWNIETSNAEISAGLPVGARLGYHVKVRATLGSIRVGLGSLNYIGSDAYNIEAKSIGYDTASKHVKLALETSNAEVRIN